jgi:threonine synthase
MSYKLFCVDCGQQQDSSKYSLFCVTCQGLLEAKYDAPVTVEARVLEDKTGIARYLPMLPINNPANHVTIGEGNTPVRQLRKAGQALGLSDLWGKLEFFSPTGSFKDRGNAALVSALKDTGVPAVTEATGGNGGLSFAAYCAAGGVTFHAFIPEKNRDYLKSQAIAFHGAKVQWIKGPREAVYEAARKFAEDSGVVHLRYSKSIYFIEGQKTISYELPGQFDPMPDHIVIPVGNGSIHMGMYRGMKEMLEDGRIKKLPALHAVQAEETSPLVAAYEGKQWTPYEGESKSIANGITVKTPPRPSLVAQGCRETGGRAVGLPDDRIAYWQRYLAANEGLFVEAASATTIAGVEKLKNMGVIKPGQQVLAILTGLGIKEPFPHV